MKEGSIMIANFFKNVNTLAELKSKRNELVKKYHPDNGGDSETMKEINSQFDELKKEITIDGTIATFRNDSQDIAKVDIDTALFLIIATCNMNLNRSIIFYAATEAGLINPADVSRIITGKKKMPTFRTFNEWQASGYGVKKGEHAAFTAYIWKPINKKRKATDAELEKDSDLLNIDADGFINYEKFYKVKAFYFGLGQVEKITIKELESIPNDCERITRDGIEIIKGNTKPIKNDLKAAGYKWSTRIEGGSWWRKAAKVEADTTTKTTTKPKEDPKLETVAEPEATSKPETISELKPGDHIRFKEKQPGFTEASDILTVESYDGFTLSFDNGKMIIGFFPRDFVKIEKVA